MVSMILSLVAHCTKVQWCFFKKQSSQGQRVTNHLCNITEELFESDLEKEEKGKNQKTNRENRAKPNLKTVQQHY